MTPEELVNLPDALRGTAILNASDLELTHALDYAKRIGAAYAAADIAYEKGRRVGEDDDE